MRSRDVLRHGRAPYGSALRRAAGQEQAESVDLSVPPLAPTPHLGSSSFDGPSMARLNEVTNDRFWPGLSIPVSVRTLLRTRRTSRKPNPPAPGTALPSVQPSTRRTIVSRRSLRLVTGSKRSKFGCRRWSGACERFGTGRYEKPELRTAWTNNIGQGLEIY
jgi:hypothetical protein